MVEASEMALLALELPVPPATAVKTLGIQQVLQMRQEVFLGILSSHGQLEFQRPALVQI